MARIDCPWLVIARTPQSGVRSFAESRRDLGIIIRVLISGASIAGPTLAYWLDRHGFDVTVVELAPALRSGGYAVDFRGGVQLAMLDRMGLLDQVRAHQTGGHPARFVDETDATVLSLPREFTGGNLEIQRADLSRLLYDHTRERVEYRFGDSIADLNQTPAGVDVTFDHAPSDRFDLVIGADGLHSRVRRLAFGPEDDYVRHLGYYIAGWDLPNIWQLDGEQRFHNTPGTLAGVSEQIQTGSRQHHIHLRLSGRPRVTGQPRPTGRPAAPCLCRARMVRTAARGRTPVRHRVYFDSVSRVEVPHWSTGRIALLGDAASGATLSGTGTGTAIVGAYALAGELASASRHRTEAFQRYEQRIRPYAIRDKNGGHTAARIFAPGSRTTLWLRNRILEAVWAAGSFGASPSRPTASCCPTSRPVHGYENANRPTRCPTSARRFPGESAHECPI